jgi:cytochrome P450
MDSLIVAGSETAATLLSGCIYYLCTNPGVMNRLTGEIRSAFSKEDDMTFRSIASLPYLSAVIEESLRKYPPFVTSLARIVPQGGAFVDGHLVPEGVMSLFSMFAIYF